MDGDVTMNDWLRSLLSSGLTGSFFLAGCVYLLKELKRLYEIRIGELEKRQQEGHKDRHDLHRQIQAEQIECQRRIEELWKMVLDLKGDAITKAAETAALAALKVHERMHGLKSVAELGETETRPKPPPRSKK